MKLHSSVTLAAFQVMADKICEAELQCLKESQASTGQYKQSRKERRASEREESKRQRKLSRTKP